MKTRNVLAALGGLVAAVAVSAGDEVFMGTWKLNEAESTIAAGAPKVMTVIYESAGDQVRITVESIAADGSSLKEVWTGRFDGKGYSVKGNLSDIRAYSKVDARTLRFTAKRDEKVIITGTIKLSADGMQRTVKRTDIDANGKKVNSTNVYDRQ
jgi:hypothetical protein